MAKLPGKKKEVITYPSKFGSHASMINDERTKELQEVGFVICTDQFGDYKTKVSHLDNGLADIYRYSGRTLNIAIDRDE